VPLGLEVGAETTYTITADGMESFDPSIPVRLDDLKLGYTQDLRLNNTYTFSASPGDEINRFNVRFYSPVGIGEPDLANFLVYSDKGNLVINNAGNYKGNVHIYNAAGQLISTHSLHTGIQNVAALPIGIYVVKVVTGQSTISRKVVLF
jgi:hypothetical protein